MSSIPNAHCDIIEKIRFERTVFHLHGCHLCTLCNFGLPSSSTLLHLGFHLRKLLPKLCNDYVLMAQRVLQLLHAHK